MDQRTDAPSLASRVQRVVVVRDGRLADRIAAACPPACSVDRIPGFLGGLAELMTGSADWMIGPAEALAGMLEAMAATLREAKLIGSVVVTDPDPAVREKCAAAGYLHVVDPGAEAGGIAGLLGFPPPGGGGEDSGDTAEPDRSPAAGPETPATERLGDSDLVEAIHDAGSGGGEGRLPDLVQRLLVRESEIPEAVLVLDTPEAAMNAVPAGHASVRVCFRGECFGRLHAPPPAGTQQLAPWAAWAARWLALDRQTRQLRELAMRDELTGVWNRRYFNRFLARILERAASERQQVTLLVFDIDDFKRYNDRHGHAAGDAILAGAAQLMQSTVRAHDVVARIGGDEFAVIFWDPRGRREEGSRHPDDVLAIARRFQKAVTDLRFPQLSAEAPGTLTISGGIAGFPWDGRTPEDLLQKADLMAMESKAQGKNAITLGATLPT